MDDFERELKMTFLDEAIQMLEGCEQCFLSLESNPHDQDIIEQIFRLAHSFKGSAGAAGYEDLASLAHHLEALLVDIKQGKQDVNKNVVNILLRSSDELRSMVTELRSDPEKRFTVNTLIEELTNISTYNQENQSPVNVTSTENISDPINLDVDNSTIDAGIPDMPATRKKSLTTTVSKDESIRVNLARIDNLVNDVGELVILQTVLFQHRHSLPSNFLQKTVSHLEKITRQIQDTSMSLRMVPLKPTFQKMQRIVRDAAQSLNKNIHLNLIGEETEIDKTILDVLS